MAYGLKASSCHPLMVKSICSKIKVVSTSPELAGSWPQRVFQFQVLRRLPLKWGGGGGSLTLPKRVGLLCNDFHFSYFSQCKFLRYYMIYYDVIMFALFST